MNNQVQNTAEDQITFKEVFRQVGGILKTIAKNWKIVIALSILGYGIGYTIDELRGRKVTFEAEIVFNLGSGSGGGGGSLGGMAGLGSFLPMSNMSADASLFSGENFIYLSKSRPVVQKTLMKKVAVNNDSLLLVNFLLDSCRIKEFELKKRDEWVHKFKFPSDIKLLNNDEKRLFNDLIDIINNYTEIEQEDPKSSFMTLRVNTANETFSEVYANNLLATIEDTYTEKKTAKTRKSIRLTEKRVDSLARALGRVENSLAREMDVSETLIFNEGKVGVKRNERSATFLQSLYAQSLQSLESLRMSMIEESVLFTIIEPIKTPLDSVADLAFYKYICLAIGLIIALITIWVRSIAKSAKQV